MNSYKAMAPTTSSDGRGAIGNAVCLHGFSASENAISPSKLQTQSLARRYRISVELAAVVAELAFPNRRAAA